MLFLLLHRIILAAKKLMKDTNVSMMYVNLAHNHMINRPFYWEVLCNVKRHVLIKLAASCIFQVHGAIL